jgi:hypothetical protein
MWHRVDMVLTDVSEERIAFPFPSTLKMEATRSSETSVPTNYTRRNITEDGLLHSHRRENLKSYIFILDLVL